MTARLHRLLIGFRPDQITALQRHAARHRTSVTAVVRAAIDQHLDLTAPTPPHAATQPGARQRTS